MNLVEKKLEQENEIGEIGDNGIDARDCKPRVSYADGRRKTGESADAGTICASLPDRRMGGAKAVSSSRQAGVQGDP